MILQTAVGMDISNNQIVLFFSN